MSIPHLYLFFSCVELCVSSMPMEYTYRSAYTHVTIVTTYVPHNDKSLHWSVYEQVPPWRSRQRVSLIIWRSWVRASQVALFFFSCVLFIFFSLLTNSAFYFTNWGCFLFQGHKLLFLSFFIAYEQVLSTVSEEHKSAILSAIAMVAFAQKDYNTCKTMLFKAWVKFYFLRNWPYWGWVYIHICT